MATRSTQSLWEFAAERRAINASTRSTICGFDVRFWKIDSSVQPLLEERIADALAILRKLDERRVVRMRSDVRHILVKPVRGSYFWFLTGTIALDQAPILKRSAAMTAVTLVHEATHARFVRAGVYPYMSTLARVERRCVLEEMHFARLLQRAGYGGTDRLLDWLGSLLDANHATLAALVKRKFDLLKELGAPRWYLRVWLAVKRIRHPRTPMPTI